MSASQSCQFGTRTGGGVVVPIVDEVVMRLEDDNGRAAGICEMEKLFGVRDIGGEAEVGGFEDHESEEVC